MQPSAEIKSSDVSLELPSSSYCSKRRGGEVREAFPPVPAPPLPVALWNSPISAASWCTLPVLPMGSPSLASLSLPVSGVCGLFPSGLVWHCHESHLRSAGRGVPQPVMPGKARQCLLHQHKWVQAGLVLWHGKGNRSYGERIKIPTDISQVESPECSFWSLFRCGVPQWPIAGWR